MTRRSPESGRDEPERLSDGASGDPALDELGRWFGAVPPARGLDDASVARAMRRLEGPALARPRWRGPLLGIALVGVTGAAAGMWALPRLTRHEPLPVPARTAPPAPRDTKSLPQPHPVRTLVPSPELPVAPRTAPSVHEPHPARSSGVPSASPSGAPSEGDLALESAALERALTALKRDHDAARALTLLERYAADFPAGVLRQEADIARVDAHLALGQRPAALAILARLPLERVGRGLELRVVRGELYAERDCSRALGDFNRVLAANPPSSLEERALYGRANCRTQGGDGSGAQADFERYLTRYPNGRYAAVVRERAGSR